MGLLDWLFKTNKKPKKKERDKWARQAEKAKSNTQSNSKRKSASYRSDTAKQRTTSTPSSSSSRRGSYVSSATTQRAQTLSKAAVKRQSAYDKYRARVKAEQNRRDLKALQRTTGKTYKNNQEIKPAVYNADPESYKEYRTNAAVIDKTKDKTVYDAKTGTSKGQTLKEYYSAPEHKKEALKEKKKTEEFINEHPVAAGFGDAYSKLVGRGVEDYKDIFSGIKGTKKERTLDTKKYDKSKAAKVANMAGVASQYLLTGGGAGLARSAGAKMLGKLTAKEGAKTIAKATAKKALKEGAKKTTKKLSKEGVKKFAKNRAAEIAADMPLDVAHSYKDSKGDAKEFGKQMLENVGLNIGVGGGAEYAGKAFKALRNKAAAKAIKNATNRREIARATVGNKAKVRKISLGESLERATNKVNEEIVPKAKAVKGRTVRNVKGEVKGRTLKSIGNNAKVQNVTKGRSVKNVRSRNEITIKNKSTGEVIYKGVPASKEEIKGALKVARKQAGSIDNLDVTSKDIGSPQARFRQPTTEKINVSDRLDNLDRANASATDDLSRLQRETGIKPNTGKNVLERLDEANAKASSDLKEAREITGFTNKAETQKALRDAEKARAAERSEQVEPVPEQPKAKTSDDYKRELRSLKKRKDSMSPRKYEETKADLEAKQSEAKAREDIEAQKVADKKRAREIERKPAKDRTPDDVRQIVEDKENAPIARIQVKIKHAETKFDKNAFRKLKTGLQKAFVDSGAAFENMARDAIKAGRKEEGEALYSAVNSLRQTEKSVQYQLFDAQTDFNYKRVGDSAHDIVKPLDKLGKKTGKDVYADTQAMLFHQHNVDRMKNGKPVFGEAVDGIRSQNEIKRIRDKYTDKELKIIDAQIDKIHKYFDNLRTMRREAGLISKELDDYLKELYPNYVPTKRAGDFGIEARGEFNTATGKAEEADHGVVGAPGGKEATGSNKDLLSIEDQMYRATKEVWSASKTNNLVQKVMELQGFKGNKLDAADLGKKADGTERTFEDVISESLFATGDKSSGFRLRWFDDGVAKSAKCTEEVYNSLKALNGQGINLPTWAEYAEKALDISAGNANSIFKKLCTEWNPFFALYRNPMRDIQDAFMYSKDFKGFIAHMPTAIKRMANQDEYWQLWKASGGTQSSLFDITSKIKKSKNPLRRLGLVNSAVEQYPRFTEFCSILDKELKGAPVSSATREMIDKASQAGADITVNFGRSGDVTKVLNRYLVPFLNPGVQGVSKGVRLITERSGAKAFVSLATKAAALGFAPAVINEALLGDDEGYKQMNPRDKMTNYVFKIGGNYIKIPKGRLLSLIGMGGLKATNNFMGGNDYSLEEMKDVAVNQSAPANPLSDNILMTAKNALNNRTWYGGNIQSDYDEDEQKAQWRIYDADTTSLAKKLAKTNFFKTIENDKGVVGVSPKKIDAMLKGYTGVLGELAMPLMTQRAKGAGATGSIKNLAKRTFTIDPRYQNRFSTDFYDKVNETARKADDTHNKKDEKESKYYGDQSKRISTFNKVINEVQGSNRSYSEKNKIVDALQDEKNKVMKGAIDHKNPESGFDMDDMKSVYESSGAKYAIKYFVKDSDKKDTKSYAKKHDLGDIIDVNRKLDRAGFPTTRSRQPKIKALAIEEGGKGNKDLYKYFNVDKSTRNMVKKYHDAGGNIKELGAVQKNIEKTAKTIGKKANELPKGALAYALSAASGKNRVYQMYDESTVNSKGYWEHSVRSGQGMAATGLTLKDRQKAYEATKGASGHPSKDSIMKYLAKKNWTKEQKSYMFWQLASWNTKENPYGDYTPKFKAKKTTSKGSGKPGQVDYSSPEAKEFMNNFGANMDKERRRVGEKLYRAAQSSVRGINAPYKNDKDYLPKETLQVVRSGDERLDADALKALKSGGIKKLVKQAQKNLPKVKEPEDSDSIFGDGKEGSSGGGGRGYYRRYGRRGHGRGGSGGSGSTGTATKKPEEIKTKDAKYDPSTWNPTKVSTDSGWTDSQIRKVYNTLIKQGLTQQQAVARIAQLWHTRFS